MTIQGADRAAFLEKAMSEQAVPASLAGWEPAWWTSRELREEGEQGQIRALRVRPGPGSWSSGNCMRALAGKTLSHYVHFRPSFCRPGGSGTSDRYLICRTQCTQKHRAPCSKL